MNTMKFDLHVHSCYSSDCDSKIDDILKHSEMNGLDGVAICDHNTIDGSIKAIERAEELGSEVIVIPSIEVSSLGGHILILGIYENIKPKLTVDETISKARELGGTIIIPHPFKRSSHGLGYIHGIDIDAIEVINSRCLNNFANKKAQTESGKLNIPGVGGSDAHIPEMIGRAYTEINTKDKDVDSILNSIKDGKVQAGGSLTPSSYVLRQIYANMKKAIVNEK
ncbi:PHP domain-containing protein [Methanosalsum natronophilum]|nr:PHP domain-containing protein [Methanosalsum natronophilum]